MFALGTAYLQCGAPSSNWLGVLLFVAFSRYSLRAYTLSGAIVKFVYFAGGLGKEFEHLR